MKKKPTETAPTGADSTAFEIVEAYKTLRANLLFSLSSAEKKIVVVSGSEPGAGKSTTCSNLAVLMAQTGSQVLLIDADLRKPTMHRVFHVNRQDGLTRLLLNMGDVENSIIKEVAPHLDLLPSGPIPPNPSELLGSVRMARLLHKLSEKYEYIFIDTPPINVVTDGLILSSRAAGTVLVARQNSTTYDELSEAVEKIKNVNGNLLGVVINGYTCAAGERPKRYYKRYYGYHYGYGHEYEPKSGSQD